MLIVENFIREYGLWAVIFGAMFEGELTLLFAGVLAQYGLFTWSEVFLCGTFGGFVGDSLGYVFGLTGKRTLSQWSFIQRAQPRLEKLSQRFGVYSIFLVKYIYGMRTASAIFWGFTPMKYRRFAPLTLASCGVWVAVMASIGFFFSEAIELVIGRVQRIGFILLTALLITLLVTLTVYLIQRFWLGKKIPELGILGLREPREKKLLRENVEPEIILHRPRARKPRNKSQAA